MTSIFESVLNGIYSFVGNYGWSVVIFTLLVRLVLLPLDVKSRKSMRALSKVQPKAMELQKKYANDKDKLNRKISELYKKEHVNPLMGCLPMLLQLVVLFIMFGAMRNIATAKTGEMLFGLMNRLIEAGPDGVKDVAPVATESFLWIRNIFQPDNFGSTILPSFTAAKTAVEAAGHTLVIPEGMDLAAMYTQYINLNYGANLFQTIRVLFINISYPTTWAAFTQYANGLFILPLFAALSQVFMTKVSSAQQTQMQPGAANDAAAAAAAQQNPMNSAMIKWFFPLFSLYICAGYTSAFAVYWAVGNIFVIVQQLAMNMIFARQDRLAAQNASADEDDDI